MGNNGCIYNFLIVGKFEIRCYNLVMRGLWEVWGSVRWW
jgi:hypothetical protein